MKKPTDNEATEKVHLDSKPPKLDIWSLGGFLYNRTV